MCEKKNSFSVLSLLSTAKFHKNKNEIEIRIRLDAVFRKAGEQKISPEKRWEMGKESASLDGQENLLLAFLWQNGALQGALCLLTYFSLVNCITLAYKIFYPIYAKYIKIFIEILLRILKRNNNNNDHNQIVNTNQDKNNIAETLWRLDWLKINGTVASCWMFGWSQ